MVRMLITLCYVYLWVRFHKCYSVLIRKRLLRLNSSSSLSFSLRFDTPPAPVTGRVAAARPPAEEDVFLQLGNKSVNVTKLQVYDDLSKWTVLLGSSVVCVPRIEYISFIIEADGQRDGYHASQVSNKKVLKWSDCCLPLARSPGRPFRAVARASLEDFSRLAVAFIEDRLQLDKGLVPSKIIPVLLQDSTLTELLEKQFPHNPSTLKSLQLCGSRIEKAQSHSCSPLLTPKAKRRFEQRRGSEPIHGTQDMGSAVSDSKDHADGHGHHLHLSHCNECLELENSTILSVKYASAENIPDLPDDDSLCLDNGEDSLGEVGHQSKKPSNNAPNVLVYTGSCQKRFTAVCHVLTECLNLDNYIIYPLQPQQCLTDPWLDSTRLLVLAEEHALTPELQTRILSYLNQGGRVLGLCSSLCPAGLLLEARDGLCGQVRRLSFTREDSTEMELSVVASGKVFVRHVQGGGEVELWGELKGDVAHQRDMVIVRVTHGEDGGEAVICQVHLENAPESSGELKVSSAPRHEVLVEILTSLGLSCRQNQTPAPSPVYLLATSQDVKTSFTSWLRTRADTNGLVALSKVSLRVASASETRGSPMPDGSLLLFTDSPEPHKWDQFSMETYNQNLKTSVLGRTVLYADVVSSTMDLLEGLHLHLPKEVGLIAIAAQQSKGRGRGRNAWLSPLGCAMFTLSVQVELSSKLGQRIPFLQHLAALAVIEAVRTLPGYQDIDLRVKWPNDIYNSNLVKLGGVLVTSTVMGSTFHLLIGCGFNVTNSNPTSCINDLIQQYNAQHSCNLKPLSGSLLIARTVSCLEALISSFQQGGPDAVLPTYYKRWLHSGSQVSLWSEDGLKAQVVGLDNNGFLQVYSEEQGLASVESDGNSFDMLKNMIVIKKH